MAETQAFHPVYIGLGSNLGHRSANLHVARLLLDAAQIRITRASGVYATPAWGLTDQPSFENQVLEIASAFEPLALMRNILNIEREMGRERTMKWGPRVIDIDLLSFTNQIIRTEELQLPHPHLAIRPFVLVPWAEIAPDHLVPGFRKTIRVLLADLAYRDAEGVARVLPVE